jgi:hypothetical protein
MIDSNSPVYNAVVFYILIIIIILIIRPKFMYCNKKKKFKTFGIGKDKTLLSFPLISIMLVIMLYIIFIIVKILAEYLENK